MPKEKGYCEKQSGIIVIYVNMVRTYNSVIFQEVCLQNIEIVDLLKYSGFVIFLGRGLNKIKDLRSWEFFKFE